MSCLALAGCLGTEDGVGADDAVNTTPASLAEANAEMDKIDRIMAEGGSTPALVENQRLVRDRLEVFSGRVDKIDIAPGHSVDIFAAPDGQIYLSERMKIGDASVLKGDSSESIPAIYARLAPGRALPAAIANAPSIQTDVLTSGPSEEGNLPSASETDRPSASDEGITTTKSALTDSAADGLWFTANHCNAKPAGTVVFRGSCVIDKIGNRFSQATSDHATMRVAFTVGSGSIFLRRRDVAGGPIKFEWRILRGELLNSWSVGPWKDVKTGTCLPLFACETQRQAQQTFMRFDIEGASGKKYDMIAIHYNNPSSWNGP
jgi:hypothetical protein